MSRLYGQFPGDVGCFSPYLLNFLQLSPGESIYLAPNEPHAYLYGGTYKCLVTYVCAMYEFCVILELIYSLSVAC